jgi:uncharacterized protein YggU (UPF0235/DUF167 family)
VPTVRVALRVSPGAGRSEIVGRFGDGWKVRVAAQRERGRANDAVVELLSTVLEVPRSHVRIAAGATARDKIVEADGIAPDVAERRLAARARKGDA